MEVVNGGKTPARQDKNGDEVVITLDPLRDGLQNLLTLKARADDTKTALGEAIKAVAEKSGLMAKTIRTYVNARASDSAKEARRDAEQMSLVFDEMDTETAKQAAVH